jgi:dihydroflavonol-4-reductase
LKALVTGAAGFIGSNVVRALLEDGFRVRAMHLPREDVRNLRGLHVERLAGDVLDRDSLRRAMKGSDVVFHLAAAYALWTPDRGGGRMRAVNVGGTENVLDVARELGIQRVVYTSSIARFGGQGMDRRATEESPFALGPTGDRYAQTKADAHEIAVRAAKEHDVVIVAPCGPIGPGDVGPTPTGRLLLSAIRYPVAVVASTVTTFADVRDMARGHVLAAGRGKRGETYLLGTEDLSVEDVARMAMNAAGVQRPILRVPFGLASMAAHGAKAWADRVSRRPPLFTPEAIRIARLGLRADCSKAVRELGVPQSPIRAAVGDAIAWFVREGYLRRGPRASPSRAGPAEEDEVRRHRAGHALRR